MLPLDVSVNVWLTAACWFHLEQVATLYDMLDALDETNVDAMGTPLTVRSVFVSTPRASFDSWSRTLPVRPFSAFECAGAAT